MNKLDIHKLPSHIQFDTVSPATKLLEKRRKMYEVHEAFEAQKEEFKKKQEQFQNQEEQIRQRDLAIQGDLINFSKFIQENDAQKQRAEKRLIAEKREREQREKEIKILKDECQEKGRQQGILEQKVAALRQYQEFLQRVIKSYSESQYESIDQILLRHQTLLNSQSTLTTDQNNMEKEYEKLKLESTKLEKERNQEILQLGNENQDLQTKLEAKRNERNALQSVAQSANQETSTKSLTFTRLTQAIDNMYQKCITSGVQFTYEFGEFRQDDQERKEREKKQQREAQKKGGKKQKEVKKDQYGQEIKQEEDFKTKKMQILMFFLFTSFKLYWQQLSQRPLFITLRILRKSKTDTFNNQQRPNSNRRKNIGNNNKIESSQQIMDGGLNNRHFCIQFNLSLSSLPYPLRSQVCFNFTFRIIFSQNQLGNIGENTKFYKIDGNSK